MIENNPNNIKAQDLAEMKNVIKQKYGGLTLYFQSYEHVIKTFVSNCEIKGLLSDIQSIKETRENSFATKTLGQITKDFINNVLICQTSANSMEDDDLPDDLDQPHIHIVYKLELSPEYYKSFTTELAELVNLRNELVHCFLKKYPLSSKEDCQLAVIYLDDCYQRFDRHIHQFRQLLESFSDVGDLSAFINTPVIHDYFFHGILPNGEGVQWERSTIVALLKDAETKLNQEEWTSLQCAIEYIKKHRADHSPKRYGCNSWRHVLHESKQFEIRKEPTNGHQSRIWYRSHTK